MKRGGGSGGGAGSARAFGIGMEPLEENDDGVMAVREDVVREYCRSKPGLGSYTRIEGGDVKRGMSMLGKHQVSPCHD
jgi:hypothetical protein